MIYERKSDLLLKYWPFLVAAAMIIVGWANIQSTNTTQDSRLSVLEDHDRRNTITQTQILVQLSQIQSDLSWVRSALGKSITTK